MARKRDTVQEIAPEALPPCDPVTVAPINSDGLPDLYNYMPTRFVPRAEAKARGWQFFYEGTPCRYGHTAPRYVSNERQCVDCKRHRAGKPPIGGQAQAEWKPAPRKQPDASAPGVLPLVGLPRAPEPDRQEKAFLEQLALLRDFDKAAYEIKQSPAVMNARLSWSAPFKQAVTDLCQRLSIPMPVVFDGDFQWDEDKRARLLEVWINTGDIATALDSIRVTPAEFFREAARNQGFSAKLEEAEVLATKALEWRATQLALAGNDKLLQMRLKASDPKYKDSLNLNVNVMDKLTDDQLRTRLRQLRQTQGAVIDGEFTVTQRDESQSAPGGAADSGGDATSRLPQSIRDLL